MMTMTPLRPKPSRERGAATSSEPWEMQVSYGIDKWSAAMDNAIAIAVGQKPYLVMRGDDGTRSLVFSFATEDEAWDAERSVLVVAPSLGLDDLATVVRAEEV